MENSSLDKLAHIANMSHALHRPETGMKLEVNGREMTKNGNGAASIAQQNRIKKMACTCCRQQKLKCDAHERHPRPCTQCMKKNLVCEVNANFRRKDKRAHLARIEQEFLELKRSFQDLSAADDFHKMAPNLAAYVDLGRISPSITTRPQNSPAVFQELDPTLTRPLPPSFAQNSPPTAPFPALPYQPPAQPVFSTPQEIEIPENVLFCEEKTVESVVLAPQMIRELYLEYVRHYHPILPIVDVLKGPDRIHRLCPALFWVIMFVALRRYDDEDKSLLLRLLPLVKNILAEISISPITRYNPTEDDEPILNACSVFSTQAFILYSLWPPLTSSLSADSSWVTIGTALFQGIRIGLNSAGQHSQENGVSSTMTQEQVKTWIQCNIVSEDIATAFGFPAFVQFDFALAQKFDLLVLTRHSMEIAHFEDQVAKTLTMGANTETGLTHINERIALVKVLLKQLDDLEIRLNMESSHEDGHRRLHYLVARIHLLTCYFLDAPSIPSFELFKGLVKLFNASIALTQHVDACETKARDFVRYLPVVSVLHIWQASCIICRLANSPLKSMIDVEQAKSVYLTAIRLVAKASVLKHDIAYRASGIMRNMWQLFRQLDERQMSHLSLKVKSRMTALVFFDCLALLRDKVGMAKLNINTDLRENEAGLNEDANSVEDSDASESLDEDAPQESGLGETEKTTPGSNGSSIRVHKRRRLSAVQDAESKARKIIRTIPLDPQPIAALGRSSIFKVVNPSTNLLPSLSTRTDESGISPRGATVPSQVPMYPKSGSGNIAVPVLSGQGPYSASDTLATLELNLFDMNNDLLWKDVDSLMNDFGFHV